MQNRIFNVINKMRLAKSVIVLTKEYNQINDTHISVILKIIG